MEKILHLTLKKEWFDLIQSGVKTEEYREIKSYWMKRFMPCYDRHLFKCKDCICSICSSSIIPIKYSHVIFRHGYTKDAPTMQFEIKKISIGKGRKDWGGGEKDVFILKLGKKIF